MRRTLIAGAAVIAAAVAVAPAQAGSTKTVAVKNNAFSPGTVSIKKGDKVVWRWTQGGVAHNVTPASGGAGSRTTSTKGYTFTKTFTKAGTFRYVCTLHSSMKSTVKVG
ncbi:cupredoxin domain-containing protein [Solirubrobacter sp. CPCC 204708]|uniref:Plastocyanin/azurin family copper-binding protein n=1 Tax=Solirubrobacter deserti TaxID=2282478 RepID=A0ABT4RJG6_9ACTN|nr:plastocyanin/azurin family copper-binding protein [Solirubrobacter deserti]MBE2319835.1 cupredoxin domain-containing protein [Solirubrobacter deserti]MDA0138684.1 plastocyanin/azurin family copper-binding protein [Solirubrobacter deserti]